MAYKAYSEPTLICYVTENLRGPATFDLPDDKYGTIVEKLPSKRRKYRLERL